MVGLDVVRYLLMRNLRDKLAADPLLEDCTCIPIDNLMEMLTFCMETTYFEMGSDIYRQKEGLAMGSPLTPVLANINMEYFEEMVLWSTSLKPSMWLRYVDDTLILWPHQEDVLILLDHVNSIRPSIQFTMEKEQVNKLPFLDLLVTCTEQGFRSSVYRKITFTEQYLNFNSHHSYTVKKGIVRCLQHRAKTISSDTDASQEEMISLRHNLHRNNYPERITSAPRNLDRRIEDSIRKLTTVCLYYVKGLAERIQKICSPYDIRTVFTIYVSTLRKYLFRVKPEFNMIKNCVYSIPCSCGKIYNGDTSLPLKVRLQEHWKAVVRGEIEKSGMADHIWKENGNHLALWDKVEIIDRAEHWRIRHLKESAHMSGHNDQRSRSSIELNTIWEPIIKKARWKKKSEYEHS